MQTTIATAYAPGLGYYGGPDILSCSGRFYVQSPQWVWEDEWETYGHYTDGTNGAVMFTVDSSHSFNLVLAGKNALSGYGLTGLENPVAAVYNYSNSTYVGTFYGEGTHDLSTLPAGNYQVIVFGQTPGTINSPLQSGIVVASVVAY